MMGLPTQGDLMNDHLCLIVIICSMAAVTSDTFPAVNAMLFVATVAAGWFLSPGQA